MSLLQGTQQPKETAHAKIEPRHHVDHHGGRGGGHLGGRGRPGRRGHRRVVVDGHAGHHRGHAGDAAGARPTAPDPATVEQGPGETLLTGDTAAKVTAAAKAAVPGATVIRVETDSGGSAYEAHMQKSDGTLVTVKLDKSFKVTATDTGFGGGGHHGDGDGTARARPARRAPAPPLVRHDRRLAPHRGPGRARRPGPQRRSPGRAAVGA